MPLMLSALRGPGKTHLVSVMKHKFLTNYCSRGLKFLQVTHESFDCDLTQGFFHGFNHVRLAR